MIESRREIVMEKNFLIYRHASIKIFICIRKLLEYKEELLCELIRNSSNRKFIVRVRDVFDIHMNMISFPKRPPR